MKKISLLIVCIFLEIVVTSAQGINFEKPANWAQLMAKAKKERKYIFLDAHATWCIPCKVMSAETFRNKDVGEFVNDRFISVKVQMDQTKDDDGFIRGWYYDAKNMADSYQITAYPTILFFSPDGDLIYKSIGYMDPKKLLDEVAKSLDPNLLYIKLLEKYVLGKLDTAGIRSLVLVADQIHATLIGRMLAEEYTSHLDTVDFYKKDNLLFIGQHLKGSNDRNFKLFSQKAEQINAIVSRSFAEDVVMGIIDREEIKPYRDNKTNWDLIEKTVIRKYGELGEERLRGVQLLAFGEAKDWVNFGKYYKLYFDLAVKHQRSFVHINNVSWSVFEHVTDPSVLQTAVKAMKFNIETYDGNHYTAIDTYANLLYKSGNVKEAILWEKKAVKLTNNAKEFVKTLEKMKRREKTWPVEN